MSDSTSKERSAPVAGGSDDPSVQLPGPASQLLARLESGWRPDLLELVAEIAFFPPAEAALILRADQRQRWLRGERVRAETYLERCPPLRADRDAALDLIYGEFLLRERQGEEPVLAEFAQRFPDYAAVLRTQIELHLAMAPASRGASAETPPHQNDPPCAAPATPVAGYEIMEELGRGGMGIVYKARQTRLKRVVALKMLLAGTHAGPEQLARFRTEAEAVARLQHPNIVQIYEVGDAQERPFLALEFVDGGSLKGKLHGTPQPAQPSAQLVETLAHAIHYAHQHGVVHRDLKPGNILLQMPSGQQRVPSAGQSTNDEASTHSEPAKAFDTRHACSLGDATLALPKIADFGLAKQLQTEAPASGVTTASGTVLGTPCYMSPEQAAGRPGNVGPAADIYALGAMLYELLSGRPPFQGETPLDTLQQVMFQEPVPPSRLRPKLPRDLETICLKCLDKDPARRYGTAAALAEDLRRFQAREPIAARPTSAVERSWRWCRRNPSSAGLVAALLLLTVTALGAAFWYVQDRADQRTGQILHAARAESEIKLAIGEALKRRNEAFQEMERPERWQAGMQAAFSELRRAEFLLADNQEHLDPDLSATIQDFRTRLERQDQERLRAGRLDQIRVDSARLVDGKFGSEHTGPKYHAELLSAGLDVEKGDITGLAERIKISSIRSQLVAALDEWVLVAENPALLERLLTIARAADPEAWRDQFRKSQTLWNLGALQVLAADPRLLEQPSYLVILLGRIMATRKGDAERVLRLAQERRPDDFHANFFLGNVLHEKNPSQAAGFYRAALAVRPKAGAVYNNLGQTLAAQNDQAGAVAAYKQAIALDPKDAMAHSNLGNALQAQNDLPGAIAAYERAIAENPVYAKAYYNLGLALAAQHELAQAAAAYKKAIALDSKLAKAHAGLATVLASQNDLPGAVAELKLAITLDPNDARTHYNLGKALTAQKDLPGAVAAYQQAIALNPKDGRYHNNLGNVLKAQRNLPAAIAAYKQAIAVEAKLVHPHIGLGACLAMQNDLPGAIAAFEQAILLDSQNALAHYSLGNALRTQKNLPAAVAAYKQAIAIDAGFAEAHCNLGHTLEQQGKFSEALAAMKTGHDLGSKQRGWPYPSAQWVKDCQRLVQLDSDLAAVLKGDIKAQGVAERLEYARLCQYKQLYAAGVAFYREAFQVQPDLADNMQAGHRYDAACYAALAGCGQGEGVGNLSERERQDLLQQALDWLSADLAYWTKVLEGNSKEASLTRRKLLHWQTDLDLVGVRDEVALNKLPQAQRNRWRHFWSDVAALLKKTPA